MGIFDFLGPKKTAPTPTQKMTQETAQEKSTRLRDEAMANARQARERLGDDTIQKIAAALDAQSAGKRAQRELQGMDKAALADHLKTIIGDDR